MSRKPISQREARALKRRVDQLEYMIDRQQTAYSTQYPNGTHLGDVSWDGDAHIPSAVYTARRLGNAVVVMADGQRKFRLYAIQHPKIPTP